MRFLFVLLISPLLAISQKNDLNKWHNSVINIESQQSKFTLNQINDSLFRAGREGRFKKPTDTIDMLRRLISEKETSSGTAIYIKYDNKEYLISAKHVLADKTISNYLSQNISIRTPLDFYLGGNINNFVINNTNKLIYAISDSADLCVISLQGSAADGIRNLLKSDGYEPMSISDKDLSYNLKTTDDIIAIGYPDIASVQKLKRWNKLQAGDIVVPVTTFGKVSMFHKTLPFFYGDITVYPGNSGGPIISNNKLVGIVSAQAIIPVSLIDNSGAEFNTNIYSRGSLAIIAKAKYLIPLLEQLQQKK